MPNMFIYIFSYNGQHIDAINYLKINAATAPQGLTNTHHSNRGQHAIGR